MPTAEEQKMINTMKKTSQGAYEKSKSKEPKVRITLPAGIINGIARFTSYKLGKDKNNKPYVILTGICITPTEHSGGRVQRSHFLSKNKYKTLQDKYDDMFSDIQLLGIDTASMNGDKVLEEVFDGLKKMVKSKPLFKFNTWQMNSESQVVCFINGPAEEDEVESIEYEVPNPPLAAESDDDDDSAVSEDSKDDDDRLSIKFEDEEDEKADTDEVSEGDWVPAKGDTYGFAVNANSTIFQVEVTKVLKTKKTANLKRLKDEKEFKGKSWDSLHDVEEAEDYTE